MLDDLLTPDEIPESRSWHDGTVRLASSFAVYAPEARARGGFDPVFAPSADAIYEAVELLAGEDWLITHWHDACHYRGADRIEGNLPPVSRQPLMNAVAKRWIACGGRNAGDLGVFAMHELALTYALTHRRFHAALERWELDLYGAADSDSEMTDDYEGRLRDLWGAHARLRDWLNPLNLPGLHTDLNKAWLPATNHKEVIAVDDRVDEALSHLSKLGEMLRNSFQLLHIRKSEAQRERTEALQRRAEILAPIFLVPTLIVGFYGANTWVPGEHRHWGFMVMVGAMLVLTTIVMVMLLSAHRRGLDRTARRDSPER